MSKHKTKKIYNSSKQQGWANSDSKLLADNHVYVASDVLTRLPQFIRPRHYWINITYIYRHINVTSDCDMVKKQVTEYDETLQPFRNSVE